MFPFLFLSCHTQTYTHTHFNREAHFVCTFHLFITLFIINMQMSDSPDTIDRSYYKCHASIYGTFMCVCVLFYICKLCDEIIINTKGRSAHISWKRTFVL